MERGSWPDCCTEDTKLILKCPRKYYKCSSDNSGKYCFIALLQWQPDFWNQKSWLQEEIEAAGYNVIFYPKIQCELNSIEQFWGAAKYYTREHCSYAIDGLWKYFPKACKSNPSATINQYHKHCCKIIIAYRKSLKYGTEEFT